ncbi:hypothetical protein F503_03690 [Ophiostoma piceae UAMH 11346]|uniref:DUF7908 domain-containing protein n=1 Tax=Ophiostoma piceae (strain UAMH 11346) TaxID=1262450 RepID=S3CWB4_OPHP1|nr:hypothetical protein F503_03690 [Ophiostoma piceae UAMH 11346]
MALSVRVIGLIVAIFGGGSVFDAFNDLYADSTPQVSLQQQQSKFTDPFLLQLGSSHFAKRSRYHALHERQSYAFVVTESTVPACQAATEFLLVGDQLYANGELVTADPANSAYQSFPDASPSSPADTSRVSNGFSIGHDGTLQWTSDRFASSKARFCISSNNMILAIFSPGSAPSDCTPIDLNYVSSSQCPRPIVDQMPGASPQSSQ